MRILLSAEDSSQRALAREFKTSRKFIAAQVERVEGVLAEAFSDTRGDYPVIEITERWLVRAVRSLAMNCHSSVRGIVEHLAAVCGVTVHAEPVVALLKDTTAQAERFNRAQDLSGIRMGAQDEIFSQGQAVLAGVDVASTYLYLLESPGGRDSTAWGVALLDKQAQQQLSLERMISDAAKGLRLGMYEASPTVIQHGDLFHAIDKLYAVLRHLENRAYDLLDQQYDWEKKHARMTEKGKDRRGYSRALGWARMKATAAIAVRDAFALLSDWLQELWQVVGYAYADRSVLYDWLLEEMARLGGKQVKSLVTYLRNEQVAWLEFVRCLDANLDQFRREEHLSPETLAWLCQQRRYTTRDGTYWKLESRLGCALGERLKTVQEKLAQLFQQVVRASSIVECINSLLRPYFFLRQQVGKAFLPRLQFYLNTRKYRRSGRRERVGKSPWELLTGKEPPHWLDILEALDAAESLESPPAVETVAA